MKCKNPRCEKDAGKKNGWMPKTYCSQECRLSHQKGIPQMPKKKK